MWRLAGKVGLSVFLMWIALRGRDFGAASASILSVHGWALALAGGTLCGTLILLALRWADVLSAVGHRKPFRLLFPIVLIGQFFNQTLPSTIGGDAMRVWLLHKSGVPGTAALSSTLIDRLLGILAILLLVTGGTPGMLDLPIDRSIVGGVMALVAIGYVGLGVAAALDRLPGVFHRINTFRFISAFSADMRKILLSPSFLWRPLLHGIIIQLGVVLIVFTLARGLGHRVDLASCLIIVPLSNLVLALPISIGGWGVRENFFVFAFQTVGLQGTEALALSVLYGLLTTAIGLVGGIVWLFRRERGRAEEITDRTMSCGE